MSYRHARDFPQDHVQPLEARRLLSLAPVGAEAAVQGQAGDSIDVAVAGDGSFIVAADVVDGGVSHVTAFRYSAAGEQVGEPLRLYTYVHVTEPAVHDPRVAVSMDADGDAVVAYNVFEGLNSDIYFSRISRTGEVADRVHVAGGFQSDNTPSVSMDAGGGFFIGWSDLSDPRATFEARSFDAAGQPRAAQFTLATSPGIGSLGGGDIVAHPDGSGAAFAVDVTFSADTDPDEHTLRYGQTSTFAVADVQSISEPYDLFAPSVAVHPDGSFLVGYTRVDRPFGRDDSFNPRGGTAHVRRFDAAGDQIGAPVEIGPALAAGDNGTHAVALEVTPDGGFVAAFVQIAGGVDTIYAARFNAAGTLAEGADYVALATDPASDSRFGDGRFTPRIDTDARGTVVVGYRMRSAAEARYRRLSGLADLRGTELYVYGTGNDDHVIVERVRENLFVNINSVVQRFDAAGVEVLSINGFGGDDDIVNNTAMPSTIHGGDGSDTLWGGTGPDRLRGLGGDDVLWGGDGDDAVRGESGSDFLHGGDGRDELVGDAGEDTLIGASGNDGLHGDRGSDSLYGEGDNDVLFGGDAPDYFEAGAGNDVLVGGGGGDALFGLAGNDRFAAAGDGAADTVRGGVGTDHADVDDEDDVLAVETVS